MVAAVIEQVVVVLVHLAAVEIEKVVEVVVLEVAVVNEVKL